MRDLLDFLGMVFLMGTSVFVGISSIGVWAHEHTIKKLTQRIETLEKEVGLRQ